MVMKQRETCWIRMKHFFSWSWNTLNQNETVCCFIAMVHLESVSCCFKVFHCFISCCFKVFHCSVSCCFVLFHGVSRCLIALFHAVSRCFLALFQGASLLCFMMFQGVSLLFHDVSRCFSLLCFMMFQDVSLLCFMMFQRVSLLCFMMFQGVSWPWNRCSGNEPLGKIPSAWWHRGFHKRHSWCNHCPTSLMRVNSITALLDSVTM